MSQSSSFYSIAPAYLDAEGNLLKPLPQAVFNRDLLVSLYSGMVLNRQFDNKAIALQRTGRLGTYASTLGQEAIGVGVASCMASEDILVPSFREHGAQLLRGVSMQELLLYWGGDERGSNYAVPKQDFPVSVTVGGHLLHAVGVAMALKLRQSPHAVVCLLGDGATSKGDFYEALNFAGVWQLPVLFVVSNNQWAISTSVDNQTRCESLAQKSVAAGTSGYQVDGNDILAVYDVAAEILSGCRESKGPALLEALTYRLADHTTADDARRYRDDTQVSKQWKFDPVARLKAYLVNHQNWSNEEEEGLQKSCHQQVEEAEQGYLAVEPQPPAAIFDSMYACLPEDLQQQRQQLLAQIEDTGESDD